MNAGLPVACSRTTSLPEVGGDAATQALPLGAFDELMASRAKDWPHGMTATMTHDAKRGEDARARLLALAELPGEWASQVGKWKVLNAPHLVVDGDMRAPSPAFEYMLYQALLGAWPLDGDKNFPDRMQAFARKAAREAKQDTNWLNPNQRYEDGVEAFIDRCRIAPGSLDHLYPDAVDRQDRTDTITSSMASSDT